MNFDLTITDFDSDKSAVFNPDNYIEKNPECPKIAVTCFAENLVNYAAENFKSRKVGSTSSANGEIPLYELDIDGVKIGLFMSLIGASAAVGVYEEFFQMGIEKLVVFGTCGVLDGSIADCSIIVPNRAVRDEGTSFHYAPPEKEIAVNINTLDKICGFLDDKNISHTVGKVWTTDAIYRETRQKVQKRKSDGCICVDMECSAIAALASFREKEISQFFYSADNLDSDTYEKRSISNSANLDVKHKILELAVEMALMIYNK